MTDLDDPAALRAADPGRMLDAVVGLPAQLGEAYELGRAAPGLPPADGVTSIAFCGMGGSAIAGDVIRAVYADRLPVPMSMVRAPELPAHCGPATLVVASSYSGDTAETLALFDEAVARGCRVVAVTSGGRLAARAAEAGAACLAVPGMLAMPRAAFGSLALAPVGALAAMGLVPDAAADIEEAEAALRSVLAACGPPVPTAANPAKSLARWIADRVPVIWGAEGVAAVAADRWRTQFNENAKSPALSAALPELDHNEVVGWSQGRGRGFVLVALRHHAEHPEVAARFPLSIDIARASGLEAEEIWASDGSPLAVVLELALRGDLTTTYLAIARGIDPTPIDAIARLKRALADA